VLTTDTEAPEVTQTTVSADLLEALEIVTQLGVDGVGDELAALAVNNILLPVQEPRRDLELLRVLDDRYNPLKLVRVQVASAVN